MFLLLKITFIKIFSMPSKLLLAAVFFLLCACSEKHPSLSGDAPVDVRDFIAAFPDVQFPFKAADTNFAKLADTTSIGYNVFTAFIPDSVISTIYGKNAKKITVHPLGKIQKEKEVYLLVVTSFNKKAKLSAFLFNKDNKYLSSLSLLDQGARDGYVHTVSITSEPTFILSREKTDNKNELAYTRTGYAFNSGSGEFISVLTDTNEDEKRNNEIINPIDTLPRLNKWSGDYVIDKRNYISVRDGSNPNKYNFFIHFENNDGDCTGELKGDLRLRDATHAYFQESGDPCVIDFTLDGSELSVKEQGNCGNHRGIKCFFDDSYRKKRETKVNSKKHN